jgi:hypothetical protein
MTDKRVTMTFEVEARPAAVILDPSVWLLMDAGSFIEAS